MIWPQMSVEPRMRSPAVEDEAMLGLSQTLNTYQGENKKKNGISFLKNIYAELTYKTLSVTH